MITPKSHILSLVSKKLCNAKKQQPSSIWCTNFISKTYRRDYTTPPAGSGAGKGGGAGGTVRESGGGLGRYAAAHEEEYFFNKQRQQLEQMKKKLEKEGKSPSASNKEEK